MRKLEISKKFQRDMKRLDKQGADIRLIVDLIEKLKRDEPVPQKHRDHALVGDWKGFRELHVASDWIFIYELSEARLYLARTGSHAEIFNK